MRHKPSLLALTILLAAPIAFPAPLLAQQAQVAARVMPDPETSLMIEDYNRQTTDPALNQQQRIAIAEELDTQLQALLTAAADNPQKIRNIVAAMKAARLELPLTEEIRSVLENAEKTAIDIRKQRDEAAIAELVEQNAGDPEAIADAVSDYITGSDDPVRTTGVATRMAVKPQYESVKSALGEGIGRAIATLGITQPELASRMLAVAQEVDDPALQSAIAEGEQEITGSSGTTPSENDGADQDPTPEEPVSAS